MHTDRKQFDIAKRDFMLVSVLLLISLIMRLYAFINTPAINHDGVWYINQAKALTLNNWTMAKDCGYDFISLYHLLIPVFYRLTGDWITAGMSISLLFGSLAVVPMYLVLRHFFSASVSFMAGLAFCMNPFFVSYSVELVKDPIFWFFGLLGIYLFITAIKNDKKAWLLLLSNISFLIAGFARFEIVIYFMGSLAFILFFEDKKFKKLFLFMLPVLVLIALVNLLNTLLVKEALYLWKFYFIPRNQRFFEDIGVSLFTPGIIEKSIISLDLLQKKIVRVIYLPYVPFFILGILSLRKEIKRDRDLLYLILISLLSLFALYLFYLKIHVLSPRYTVFFILPAFILFCSGIEVLINLFGKIRLNEKVAVPFICLYITATALAYPSNLAPRTSDKIIYKTIGEYIAKSERNNNTIVIAPDSRVMFYANLDSSGIVCGNKLIKYEKLSSMEFNDMLKALKDSGAKYFLWESRSWKNEKYTFQKTFVKKHFAEVEKWDNGQIILYRIL